MQMFPTTFPLHHHNHHDHLLLPSSFATTSQAVLCILIVTDLLQGNFIFFFCTPLCWSVRAVHFIINYSYILTFHSFPFQTFFHPYIHPFNSHCIHSIISSIHFYISY